jgi:hypothetical protein
MTPVRHLPPMAAVSLNDIASLQAQAEKLEQFAGSALPEPASRTALWRASAALRAVALLLADEPGRLAEYAVKIDGARAEAMRGEQ